MSTGTPDGQAPVRPYLLPDAIARSVNPPVPKKVVHRAFADTAVYILDMSAWKGLPITYICDQDFYVLSVESATPAVAPAVATAQADAADYNTMSAGVMMRYPANTLVPDLVHPELPFLAVALGAAGSLRIKAG